MAFSKIFSGLRLRDQGESWSQFEKDFLIAHNIYRKQHGALALELSRDLCSSAQKWAEYLLSIQTLQHSGTDHGENLFYKYSSSAREMPGQEPVHSWYNEIKNYNFSRPGFNGNTGHFTQVVWKDSREVGVGMATDGKGLFFVVGQYNPSGNITNAGYFEKNVLPPMMTASNYSGFSDRWRPTGQRSQDPEPNKNRTEPRKITVDYYRQGGDWNQFEKDFLTAHNTYRKQHGAPALQLSRNLCCSAQKWAKHLLCLQTLQHSSTDYGENLFYKYSSSAHEMPGQDPVESWYSEIKNYDFGKPGFHSNTGHFTQVVWKDSLEVGVGMATDGKGLFFVVGQYNPAGNITNAGHFEKNVLPPMTGISNDSGFSDRWRPTSNRNQDLEPSRTDPGKITVDYGRHGKTKSQFEEEAVEIHNAYRWQHGAPPLHLSQELCKVCQKWADHLLFLGALQHSNTTLGENIWYKWNFSRQDASGKEVVDTWYSEIKDYNFSKPGFQSNTGHFTQVVWKDSKVFGIAKAIDGKGMVIVVAQYNPAGNITNPGYFQKNVLPKGVPVLTGAGPNDNRTTSPSPGSWIEDRKPPSTMAEKEHRAFVKEVLSEHNKYRSLHGARALVLSSDLALEARKWAEHLVSICALCNSDTQHGENLWYRWSTDASIPTGKEVAESWYNEMQKYNFSKPGFQKGAGNFTQMIWKTSVQAGFGLATDNRGMYIVVGFYNPAGNIANEGYFEDNVLPKKK